MVRIMLTNSKWCSRNQLEFGNEIIETTWKMAVWSLEYTKMSRMMSFTICFD